MTEELISIIVPAYNASKYIEKCLNSILSQTYKNFEIIVVNDGSTDNTLDILKKCSEQSDKIKIVAQKNKGVSAARNNGLEHAKGQYIAFVDADDTLEQEFLERMYYKLKELNAFYITCGYNRVCATKVEPVNNDKTCLVISNNEYLEKLLNVQNGYGFVHMKLINKEMIKDIRFDECIKVGEDALFNIMICRNTNRIVILNEALYNYQINKNSLVRKYDENYVSKYKLAMEKMQAYITSNYELNSELQDYLENYIVYHLLLICVNYCYNPNNPNNKMKTLKNVCNIPIFKQAVSRSNYKYLSLTRKISLFALKHKLYLLMGMICQYRQLQLRRKVK